MLQHLKLLLECPLVIMVIFVSGIGGTFQFGYCISVMTSPSDFIKVLINKTCVHRYSFSSEQWQVSFIWSFTVSIYSIGGLMGSLTAGPLLAKYGRKKCFWFNSFLAMFGAVLMLLSQTAMSFEMIIVGRFIYGINTGFGFIVHQIYVTECAPKRLRGMVGVTAATFSTLGKFCGQLLGIRELLGTEKNWPWLLGFNGFIVLLHLLTLPFLPESPKFMLLDRGDRQACEKALKRLWGDKDHSREIEEMLEEKVALQGVRSHSVLELFQNKSVRWQLITIIITFSALQLSGISAVYFYCFEVFRAAGIPEDKLPYAALGIGLCELSTSLVCVMIIETTGNKVLLFRGYFSMSATLVLITVTLYLRSHVSWMPYCTMVLTFIFIICFASGPSGVTGLLPAQIFTQSFKSAAFTVACTFTWTGLFIIGMVFPIIVENLDYFCFLIFLSFCFFTALYARFYIPETKNQTVLEITAEFERMQRKSGSSQKKESTEQTLRGIATYETKF